MAAAVIARAAAACPCQVSLASPPSRQLPECRATRHVRPQQLHGAHNPSSQHVAAPQQRVGVWRAASQQQLQQQRASMGDLLIKDLLLGEDVAGQVELLLNLLSDAAAGRELSNVVSEVIQVRPAARRALAASCSSRLAPGAVEQRVQCTSSSAAALVRPTSGWQRFAADQRCPCWAS